MTLPPNPSWILRILDGGNPKQYAIAAIAFAIGFYMGDNRRGSEYWHHVARSLDGHHGHHTQREHEREYDRHHRHGESRER